MATGLALYWRSVLGWLLPAFGGKSAAVNVHFWAGIALAASTVAVYCLWRAACRWTPADSEFVRDWRRHAAHPSLPAAPDTGFFNGGQKLYFWAVVYGTAILVLTGLVWWFRRDVPHSVYAVCRTTHRIVAVILSAGLLVHIYKASWGEPGTFRSMIGGRVTREWARTRRPRWHRELPPDN